MQLACAHPKALTRLSGDPGKKHRRIVCIQPVERAPQTFVIELLGADACSQQVCHRLGGEELWHEIQPPIGKAQAIQDHRYRGRADTDPRMQVLVARVQVLRQSNLTADPRDDPQMIQSLNPQLLRYL
jgi:hypothetical protein